MNGVVVLAGSLREANAYCRDKGIRATFAKSSAQVKQATIIIELPGFRQRRDRFALMDARRSRARYGKDVLCIDDTGWTKPTPIVDDPELEQDVLETLNEDLKFGDLSDPDVQAELKAALNEVGLTLKKLPQKKSAEAPTVDAPEGF
jgi:hypothetical protein